MRQSPLSSPLKRGERGISDHAVAAFYLSKENRHLSSFRLNLLVAVLPPSVALFLSLLLVNPFLSDAGDNATYMVLARSLANGHGFTLLSEPGSPPFKLYPYAYPALLALQMLVLGADQGLASVVVPLKVSTALFFAGSVWLIYHLVSSRAGRATAFLTALVTATSPLALRWSADIMSEVPYLFFTLLAIWLVERAVCGRWSLVQDLAAGISLSLAFYVRSIGAVLIIAALAYVLLRAGTRRALVMALILLALSVPWIYQQTGANAGSSYVEQYSSGVVGEARGSVDEGSLALALASRAAENLKTFAIHQIPETMFPALSGLVALRLAGLPLPLASAAKLAVLLLIALGWAEMARLRRGNGGCGPQLSPRPSELYVVISVLTLSLWWPIDRFLVPLVPFLALYLVAGLRRVAGGLYTFAVVSRAGAGSFNSGTPSPDDLVAHVSYRRKKFQDLLTVMLVAPVLLSSLLVDYSAVNSNASRRHARSVSEHFAGAMPDYVNFFLAAEWLEDNSPPDSIVLSLKPTLMYVYSGRLTIDSPRRGSPAEILQVLEFNAVDFVVEDGFAWNDTSSLVIAPTIRGYQDRFALAYATSSPVTRIWRFVK